MTDPLLRAIAGVYGKLDPPPADLDDRVLFAIDLRDLDVEVARLEDDARAGTAARATERTRTITFDAHSRTIMITVFEQPDGDRVRIDGWLAPADAVRVELRAPEPAPALVTMADETGRFVFDGVPHGLVQLLVGTDGPIVVTPSLLL
jgi:hypothetical protein